MSAELVVVLGAGQTTELVEQVPQEHRFQPAAVEEAQTTELVEPLYQMVEGVEMLKLDLMPTHAAGQAIRVEAAMLLVMPEPELLHHRTELVEYLLFFALGQSAVLGLLLQTGAGVVALGILFQAADLVVAQLLFLMDLEQHRQ